MILVTSTDTPLYRRAVRAWPHLFGWMLTPRKRGIPRTLQDGDGLWCADNDCYNLGDEFNLDDFVAWLAGFALHRDRCLFVPAPDVVGDWRATLARFDAAKGRLHAAGFPLAVVLQDGATPGAVPWGEVDAVFVGGTTEWKLGQDAIALLDEAGRRGKWRHVGRVNSRKRIRHFWRHADSFDGTGFAIEPDAKLRWVLPLLRWLELQLPLPMPEAVP